MIVVFAVFVLILLFAGWFLDPASRDPARLYLDFVLTFTGYLTLLLAFFLSALSLPADLKNRTLHTIVTKPVRPSEIVLARIVGFTVVGTVLLALMGAVSYGFVVRGLSHTHRLTAADLQPAPGGGKLLKGFTSKRFGHEHAATVDPTSGKGWVEPVKGHTHQLTVEGSGKTAVYTLGPPRDMLMARVPKYGKLRFKDRGGKDMERGINVGDEWTYRSFIEGGTGAAAIWTFDGLREADFPESLFPKGLPLELTIEVFRTYKGDLTRGIPGSLSVRNPRTGQTVEVRIFAAKKFATDVQYIPRKLLGKKRREDRPLPRPGRRREVGGLAAVPGRGAVLRRAQADAYFRARDASFELNFVKGYLGIWLQMVLVIGLGVMFSTFLSGPVALIATVGTAAAGLFRDFIVELASGKMIGGGPTEALDRILKQQNLITEMEPGLNTNVEKTVDRMLEGFLGVIGLALARFRTIQLRRLRLLRIQHPLQPRRRRRPALAVRIPGVGFPPAGVRGGVSLPEDARGGEVTPQTAFVRKIVYLAAIAVLLVPLFWLSHPATGDVNEQKGRPGGKLAQLRDAYGISQTQLGEVDLTSQTINLCTLGMRGIAAEHPLV